MPNPPRPTEVKRKLGNPGKRTLPDRAKVLPLPPAPEPPSPARPLGPEGLKLWQRVWTGGGVWVSQNTDAELALLLCEAMDERVALRVRVFRDADWRDRVALRALDGQIVSMLSSLGFTPVDRSRLGVAEVQAQSKLEDLMARRRRPS